VVAAIEVAWLDMTGTPPDTFSAPRPTLYWQVAAEARRPPGAHPRGRTRARAPAARGYFGTQKLILDGQRIWSTHLSAVRIAARPRFLTFLMRLLICTDAYINNSMKNFARGFIIFLVFFY
jgi:hypothetical protein